MAIGNKFHLIRYAATLVAFGATLTKNADCPICGNEIGKAFTVDCNGISQTIDTHSDAKADMTSMEVAHIVAEALGGKFENSNLFVAHKICNQTNAIWSLELFCAKWQSKMPANEIKARASHASVMADGMLNGSVFYPMVAAVALEIYRKSSDYQKRAPKSLIENLETRLNA